MRRLIEIFLAVLFVALWWSILMPHTVSDPRARRYAAEVDISNFKTALGRFQVDCGRYPTTEEGFSALTERPPAISAALWRGSYWPQDKIYSDPWNRPYIYKCPGQRNTNAYDVYSLGPEGKGGADAIGNWIPPIDR
jgi:general secretion pathway protein G